MRFEIPEPCDEDWNAMRPTREGRFCERCQHGVIDLTRMTRRQAERRVRAETGSLCVQLAFDPADRVLFRAEPRRATHWAGGLVLVTALTAGGCDRSEERSAPVAQLEPEPCDLDGPPMMPVDTPMTPLDAPGLGTTGPVPAEVEDDDGAPTSEQRELTRRKVASQHVHMRRGRMPAHAF